MKRRDITKGRCRICKAETSPHNPNPKGFCNSCKCNIMKKWNEIPYDTRYRILLLMGRWSR